MASKTPAKKTAAPKAKEESVKSAPASYTYTSFNIFKASKDANGNKLPGQLQKTADGYKLNMKLDLGKGTKFYDIPLPEGKTSDGKSMWLKKDINDTNKCTIYIANEAKLEAQHILSKAEKDAGTKADKPVKLTADKFRGAVIAESAKHKKATPVAEASAEKSADKSMEK
ncbi:MAG TPA: hypothetical protein PLQ04_04655 [Lachnospiraceae bacterium]|nr:hypothetical protein [Lachnospiraceae bacterium]